MHYATVKSILSPQNGMNLYRGCLHGCIYCDARSTCYQINHPFEDIEVKENAPALLEQTLRHKRSKCMIGTGGMCDPYIPLEAELLHTRKCLEIIDRYGFGLSILTKSDLILRDLDLLKRIHSKSKCVVQMTLTTYEEDLCRILEPNVCTTKRRAEVLNILRDEGIPTVAWLTPILPFINDTKENVEGLLDYCIKAQVYGVVHWGIGVTLRDGDREYFYEQLDKHFPGVKEKYIRTYGNAYHIPSPKTEELTRLLISRCQENNIVCDTKAVFQYLNTYEDKLSGVQLNLFDD